MTNVKVIVIIKSLIECLKNSSSHGLGESSANRSNLIW